MRLEMSKLLAICSHRERETDNEIKLEIKLLEKERERQTGEREGGSADPVEVPHIVKQVNDEQLNPEPTGRNIADCAARNQQQSCKCHTACHLQLLCVSQRHVSYRLLIN